MHHQTANAVLSRFLPLAWVLFAMRAAEALPLQNDPDHAASRFLPLCSHSGNTARNWEWS